MNRENQRCQRVRKASLFIRIKSQDEEWIKQGAKDDSPDGSDSLYSMANKPVYQTLPLVRTLDFTNDGKYLAQNGFHEVLIAEASTGRLVSRLVGLSERMSPWLSLLMEPKSQLQEANLVGWGD